MPTTYSSNLKLALMATGGNTGQWGTITNNNLGSLLEQALTYQTTVPVADSAVPTDLISVDGSTVGDTARSLYINLTGALTLPRTVQTVAVNHLYIVRNSTTGGQSVIFGCQGGGTSVTIPNGAAALLYCDATNVTSVISYLPTLVSSSISSSTIDSTPIGASTPSTGSFTSATAITLNVTTGGTLTGVTLANSTANLIGGTIDNTVIGGSTPSTGTFSSLNSTGGALNGTTVGAVSPASGAFTTLASSGVYTNTVTTGTAPMTISSTTRVANLNVAAAGAADTGTVTAVTTNASFYPLFSSATSGANAFNLSSSKWSFNPSTGAMTLSTPLPVSSGGSGNSTGLWTTRVTSVATGATLTPNIDTTDEVTQANTEAAGTLTIAAPTGTPTNGQKLIIRVTCTNAQILSFNSIYRGSTDLGLPTTTTGSTKTDYLGFIYNSTASKWDLLAKVFGF